MTWLIWFLSTLAKSKIWGRLVIKVLIFFYNLLVTPLTVIELVMKIFSFPQISFTVGMIMRIFIVHGWWIVILWPKVCNDLFILIRQKQFQLFESFITLIILHWSGHLSQSIFRVNLFIEFPLSRPFIETRNIGYLSNLGFKLIES